MKKYHFLYCLLILCLVIPTSAFAQDNTLPSGVSDADIGPVIENYMAEHEDTTAAVSLTLFRGDDLIYENYHGLMNREDGTDTTQESVYEWGSVAKLLVWVSVMQLWEQDLVDLDTHIKTYLPEEFASQLDYDHPITLTHLMNHNAGFEDAVFQMSAATEAEIIPLEEALLVTQPDQIYLPGEVVSYSNWSTSLAAFIVEQVSGQAFADYVHEHIFQPLGMEQTGLRGDYSDNLWVKEQLLSNQGYDANLEPLNDGLFYLNLYPAGAAAGTIGDLTTFIQALIPGADGWRYLFERKETLAEMLTPTLTYPGTDIDYVNHGMWSHEFAVQALGHGGNTNMYSSYVLFDPVSQVGLVIMTNQGSETVYNYGLPALVFGEIGAMVANEERTDLGRMTGLYYAARTIRTGIANMYTLSTLSPLFLIDDHHLGANFMGLASVSYEEIAPNTLRSKMQLGAIELVSLSRFSEKNGQKRVSGSFGETLEADRVVWIQTIVVALFLVAVLASLLVLVVKLIAWLVRKIAGRPLAATPLRKYQALLAVSLILQALNIFWVANKMASYEAPVSSLYINIAASILLALVPLGFVVVLMRHWSSLNGHPWRKVGYTLFMLLGLTMTILVVVLEMYYV
ncbi:serine hydrolase domain-containing protein [Fundicoccus culcitae]|uniref:Beta-lactamase family protein n=1 Tax=Fundicoccus culcitae TaxID=2969821 RepID=A0ABY5P4I7_9LACT|nr:serine hydrolase [Fundicoccus culcitae]UUX33652.1 beta-lactamase family protein [Fundicoccus culcitae]